MQVLCPSPDTPRSPQVRQEHLAQDRAKERELGFSAWDTYRRVVDRGPMLRQRELMEDGQSGAEEDAEASGGMAGAGGAGWGALPQEGANRLLAGWAHVQWSSRLMGLCEVGP